MFCEGFLCAHHISGRPWARRENGGHTLVAQLLTVITSTKVCVALRWRVVLHNINCTVAEIRIHKRLACIQYNTHPNQQSAFVNRVRAKPSTSYKSYEPLLCITKYELELKLIRGIQAATSNRTCCQWRLRDGLRCQLLFSLILLTFCCQWRNGVLVWCFLNYFSGTFI